MIDLTTYFLFDIDWLYNEIVKRFDGVDKLLLLQILQKKQKEILSSITIMMDPIWIIVFTYIENLSS